jgi:DNA-binding transcriptional LysR family regulator
VIEAASSGSGRCGGTLLQEEEPQMEMQQIRYFIILAQTLNFTRAAEACNVTQPALTRAIKQLEEELGGDLIRRERGNSHLTELGRRMLPLMQQCYDAAMSARSLARAVKNNDVAPLSVAVSRTVNMANFVGPLSQMFAAYPGAQLKIRRGNATEIGTLLKEGEAELALAGPLADNWDRLDAWELFEEPYVLLINLDHPLARRNDIEAAQLAGAHFLCQTCCEMAEIVAAALAAHDVAMASAHEVETDNDLISLLEANAGIAFVPASAPSSAKLRRLVVRGLDVRRKVSVYAVAGRQRSHVTTTLLNLLRASEWPPSEEALSAA